MAYSNPFDALSAGITGTAVGIPAVTNTSLQDHYNGALRGFTEISASAEITKTKEELARIQETNELLRTALRFNELRTNKMREFLRELSTAEAFALLEELGLNK